MYKSVIAKSEVKHKFVFIVQELQVCKCQGQNRYAYIYTCVYRYTKERNYQVHIKLIIILKTMP